LRRSSWVNSTCATGRSKKRCHNAISCAWPSAAKACRAAIAAPASAAFGTMARPAATAPEETITTSRPASTLAETNCASPNAKRGVRPPPSAASKLLPTLSTARRHCGSACSVNGESEVWFMGSTGIPLMDGQLGTAVDGQRVDSDDGLGLFQRIDVLQHVGAATAVTEAAGEVQAVIGAERVKKRYVWANHRVIEGWLAHGHY